jgi:hypothetical protein
MGRCDLCNRVLSERFIDANLGYAWGNVCTSCHDAHGMGLGVGLGQAYVLVNGSWVKEESRRDRELLAEILKPCDPVADRARLLSDGFTATEIDRYAKGKVSPPDYYDDL